MNLRVSYSILNLWEKGEINEALSLYFKIPRLETPPMKEGKDLHQEWSEEVWKTKCLPEVFGGKSLDYTQLLIEEKIVHTFPDNPWLTLVGIPDLAVVNKKAIIYDYKTGSTSSSTYAHSAQIGVYAYLLKSIGIDTDHGILLHWDQYRQKQDRSYVLVTDTTLETIENWIITLASDMHSYLENNAITTFYESYSP